MMSGEVTKVGVRKGEPDVRTEGGGIIGMALRLARRVAPAMVPVHQPCRFRRFGGYPRLSPTSGAGLKVGRSKILAQNSDIRQPACQSAVPNYATDVMSRWQGAMPQRGFRPRPSMGHPMVDLPRRYPDRWKPVFAWRKN